MIKYTKSSTGLWFDLIYIWWNHLFTHSSFNSNPSHATDFRSSRVFCKKAFLKISKNWQKNTCARSSFLIKLCRPPMFPFYTPWKYQKTSVSQLLTRLNVINKPFFYVSKKSRQRVLKISLGWKELWSLSNDKVVIYKGLLNAKNFSQTRGCAFKDTVLRRKFSLSISIKP